MRDLTMLLKHFTKGTEKTKTGGSIGAEIETDFLLDDGSPIPASITSKLLKEDGGRPIFCMQKLELGRQKIELAVSPQSAPELLMEAVQESLNWLYRKANQFGAHPFFAPEILCNEDLLWVQEERDAIWVELDGQVALEHLCRCSSVQFVVDVNPEDACLILNKLWSSKLHLRDYVPNDKRWKAYISESKANYRADRYGGPNGFADLDDYVNELMCHDVVMHQGNPVRLSVEEVPDLDIDLFLRSVWWHYRLRRYGNSLTIEMRPFARRRDEDIPRLWRQIAQTIGL